MVVYNFKSIQPIPDAKEFVDVVLYRTQRKTPTVIRKTMKISRIRSFYMLKVKFTQNTINQKLGQIVDDFPKIDEIHPFYRYWFNIMYDKDHYKIALGQLHQCRNLVDKVGKHYVKLLKHADSLFQCKTLKRAALGRMVSLLRKQGPYVSYLEQIRQHMGRLPSIDPSTRTLILTGFPSVGKSSFLNAITDANVEVQSWAFTTQSLFVGHASYKLLQYQVIDTPGLLDHPLEERNNIELQGVTALAYLNAAILFLLDLSATPAFVRKQIELYRSLQPFLQGKPVVIVLSKADSWDEQGLAAEDLEAVQALSPGVSLRACLELRHAVAPDPDAAQAALRRGGPDAAAMNARLDAEAGVVRSVLEMSARGPVFLPASAQTRAGVHRILAVACELLLQMREAQMLTTRKQELLANRQYVAQPVPRDAKVRAPCIPESVRALREQRVPVRALTEADGFVSERMLELANGGARVYIADERRHWTLKNDDWRHDSVPFIYNGKNVLDYVTVDEDIEERLRAMDDEEERRVTAETHYDDGQLFDRLAAYRAATLNRRPARPAVRGMDLLARTLPATARAKATAAGRKLDSLLVRRTGSAEMNSQVAPVLFKRNTVLRQKQRTLADRMHELAETTSVPVDKLKEGLRFEKKHVSAAARMRSYQDGAVTTPEHLMTGKRGLGKADRR